MPPTARSFKDSMKPHPNPSSPPVPAGEVGFIGAGRLARSLALALQQAGVPIHGVASRRPESACAMAQSLQGCEAMDSQSLAARCNLVFITTPDAVIGTIARTVHWRAHQAVVHCSGATDVAVLRPAAEAGAAIGGFHPMQTFGADAQAAVASLPGCAVAIEAADLGLRTKLHALAQRLGCTGMDLPAGARARYHAAGGYASQHIHVLLAEAVRLWQSWGATEAQALSALLPLLRGTLESIAHSGLANGMPGPVSRGDVGTVQAHRQALQALDPEMRDLYDRLSQRSLRLARSAGRLDDAQAQALERALGAPPDP